MAAASAMGEKAPGRRDAAHMVGLTDDLPSPLPSPPIENGFYYDIHLDDK